MTEHLTALFEGLHPLWEMSFTAAWVAGVVFLLRLLLKNRAPKRVLCLLWLVVFARLLVPVNLESPVSLVPPALTETAQIQTPAPPQGGTAFQPAAPAQSAVPMQTADPTGTSPLPMITVPDSAENTPAPEASPFPWEALAVGVWLIGAAGMLGYGIVTWFRLRRRVRFAVRVSGKVWEDETVSSPFILGLFRPRVYLPTGLEGDTRRYILCHEFAHLRRLDHIVKPVCWLSLALHWFNPAVWAAFLLLGRDMEGACDEAVLRALGEDVKAGYSYTLLALASGGRVPAPCPLAFDEGDAKGRIKHVLSYRRPALWIIVVSVIAVIVAAVCLLTNPVGAKGSDPPAPTESEPGSTPSNEPDPTPGEGLNDQLDPWMLEVLQGKRTFSVYGTDGDIDHLKEAYFGDNQPSPQVELGKLAILDMDQDGTNELVIFPVGDDEYLYSVVGYMILHREGDTVWGYHPGWRSCGELKADGTFIYSGGAGDWGIGSMSFNGMDSPTESGTYCSTDSGTVSYVVYNGSATREEFEAATTAQAAKPEPFWYTFENGVLYARLSIPLDSYARSAAVPDFLTAEQVLLYQQAYSLYSHIFGANTEEVDTWTSPAMLPPAEPVEQNGAIYESVNGLFANWEDFEAAALSVFTPEFFQSRNTWLDNDGNPHSTYINMDGRTYYIRGARGGGGLNDNFPDTFHLAEVTGTEISFILMGHYSEGHLLEGESSEERDTRLAANWEEYIGFPMKLVLTENGWRFDEFHVTATDNALLPYANQAAPNPNLYPDNPEPEAGACVHGLDNVYVDHLTDGRLVYRCQEDFFPYYPPYPGAYSSESTGQGDYDGDGHIEEIVTNSYGTLMLCDIVDGEMKTFTLDPHTLTAGYPDADISTAWIEPGDELIYCVPLRPEPNEAATGTVGFHLHYNGTALTHDGPTVVTTTGGIA